MNEEEMQLEQRHLSIVLNKIGQAKKTINDSLDKLGKENIERLKELSEDGSSSRGYGSNDFDVLLEQLHQKNLSFNLKGKYQTLNELQFLSSEPYFSRIDLYNKNIDKDERYYIGKFSYTEDTPVVTDWRSKVASVYYRYRYPQKDVSYDTPSGLEVRDLKLKRTYEIQDGELIKYYNNDLQLDESSIIKEKIEKRTGGVLEDIIQTIQESQLDIIEADPRQICVVQGCVGSGKSTVAIHKLAHIFFNYPKLIHPEKCLMVTKSQILAGYLSTLFPKLGIFDVTYKTLRDLVYNIIFREELKIKFDFDEGQDTSFYDKKRIESVQNQVKKVIKSYEIKIKNIFKDPGLKLYASFKYSYDETPYENVIELLKDTLEEIKIQKDQLKLNPDGLNSWLNKQNLINLKKILRAANRIKNDLQNNSVDRAVKNLGLDITSTLNYTDVLVYISVYLELIGMKEYRKFEYCVVDESQDFSLLEYLILNKIVLRGRFALFGDLNQSLENDGVKDWNDIKFVINDARVANTFSLEENYRSTKQIIDFANKILRPYTDKYLPKSIDRVGQIPNEIIFSDDEGMVEAFRKSLSDDLKDIRKSIGIIVFESDSITVDTVREILIQEKVDKLENGFVQLTSNKKINYTPLGIYLMKSDDCKGLEFSKVYVLNLNLKKIKNYFDARRAFVSVTRAMNELQVYGVK
mgnify:CR=1 FL=1